MGEVKLAGHISLPVREAEDVIAVRSETKRLGRRWGHDSATMNRAELIVAELGSNLRHYADQGGEILLSVDEHSLEILSVDRGPGFDATFSRPRMSPKAGLGIIEEMSEHSDLYTDADGTVVLARVRGHEAGEENLGAGAVALAHPKEEQSGDAFAIRHTAVGLRALVVDGLGHGEKAADASRALVAVFDECASLDELLIRAHAALRSTRGAVFAAAEIDRSTRTLRYAGIGNIAGRVYSSGQYRGLPSKPGIVGGSGREVRAQIETYEWPADATLVLASDGMKTSWKPPELSNFWRCHPTVIAATLYRSFRRTNDDVTIVTVKE